MSENDNGFTFTWEIENCSMLPHQCGEELMSEMFVVSRWKNMEGNLFFYPRGSIDDEGYISFRVWTTFAYEQLSCMDILELKLDASLTIVSTEPSSDKSMLMENLLNTDILFPQLMTRKNFFEKKELYLPNDTLTLRFHLKPAVGRHEETIEHNETHLVTNFLRSCYSRTAVQVNRRSCTLTVPNINELRNRPGNASFVLETALTKSVGLKITLNLSDLEKKDFVIIEICETNPSTQERIFVKCKMTVISAYKKYQDSIECTHLFKSNVEDIWYISTLIKTSNLTRDKYLHINDTLLLQCEFAFTYKSAVYHLETTYTPFGVPLVFEAKEDRSAELFTHLEELYLSGNFCDVVLRAGDETFPVHKVVLCAMSPVFRAMFESDMKEKDSSVVEIEDVDPVTLRRLLAFMYSGALKENFSFENTSKLFSAADKYDIVSLKRRCSHLLASSLSVTSVCDILALADAHQDNLLLTDAHNFIRCHSNATFNSEHWIRFMSLNPKLSGQVMHQMWIKTRQL